MQDIRESELGAIEMIASDSDDTLSKELGTMPSPISDAENQPVSKKERSRKHKVSRVTKTKVPSRTNRACKSATAHNIRKALIEKVNDQDAGIQFRAEDVGKADARTAGFSGDELDASTIAPREEKLKVAKTKALKGLITTKSNSGKPLKVENTMTTARPDIIDESLVQVLLESPNSPGEGEGAALGEAREDMIPETQKAAVELICAEAELVHRLPPKQAKRKRGREPLDQGVQPKDLVGRRAGNVEEAQKDSALRRRMGDLTRKNEVLQRNYDNLREVGVVQAIQKYDELKKHSIDTIQASEAIVASLKKELAAKDDEIQELRDAREERERQLAKIAEVQEKNRLLTKSLSEARAETKTLSVKLAATRAVSASVESATTKTPGIVGGSTATIRMVGSAEAAETAQLASLKEDLYSDLTGLIVRGIKRGAEEDIYDCIQTGRNGTLHFKLGIANERSVENYDDAQCVYIPQLDSDRDGSLMAQLPDYLVDEITFPRPHAARFFARVVKALTMNVEGQQ